MVRVLTDSDEEIERATTSRGRLVGSVTDGTSNADTSTATWRLLSRLPAPGGEVTNRPAEAGVIWSPPAWRS